MRSAVLALAILATIPLASVPFASAATDVTLSVPASGQRVSHELAPGRYTITASGTYCNGGGAPCPAWTDADYHQNGAACDDLPGDLLDLLVNEASPWNAPCDAAAHTYATAYSCPGPSPCTVSFRIYDSYHGDNSGWLTVRIQSSSPACSDGIDNDGDGKTDYPADPACSGPGDDDELNPLACDDGVDNDGDGWTDYPNDPGCTSIVDDSENPNPACSDGIDNDGDGGTDYPSDPGCKGIEDPSERSDCTPVHPEATFCFGAGTLKERFSVQTLDGTPSDAHRVAGYVDLYRFTLNGASVTVPCVGLVADSIEANPCADAGGAFVGRLHTLVDANPVPELDGPVVASIGVCNAELTLLVAGVGIASAPVYTTC